jgi:hypothetical protein
MITNNSSKQSERGNVLFLILIAVALFAALSYVVTQSTRSGGGTTEREQSILNSAQMTQYPTALRTAIIRMILGGTRIENVLFNAPDAFSTISVNRLVFHPNGGGAVFQTAPADLMAGTANQQGSWNFNAEYHVVGLGVDTVNGNDLIAFLPGVSAAVCRQANEQLGITPVGSACGASINAAAQVAPTFAAGANLTNNQTIASAAATYTFPTAAGTAITATGPANCTTAFVRQASGCFWDTTSAQYVFYSVLLER